LPVPGKGSKGEKGREHGLSNPQPFQISKIYMVAPDLVILSKITKTVGVTPLLNKY
jgi:hypothetical protein